MTLVCMPPTAAPVATPSAHLFNEGLYPGLRVFLDDRADETATICSVETDTAFALVRLDRTGGRMRVESWRLALLG